MKRLVAIFVVFAAFASVLWVGVLHAANVRTGETPTVMSGETINGTLYVEGATIKIDGTIKGDLICFGQNLTVTGTVEGDVLCAAQHVTINGHVEGSVRVAGQTVDLNGKVDGSVTEAAMTANVDKDTTIGHDLTVVAQDSQVNGSVGRDATLIASTFSAAGAVGRDLDVTSPSVALDAPANVMGDFRYVSAAEAQVASGAKITGKTDHRVPDVPARAIITPASYVISALLGLASFLLVGVALLRGAPGVVTAAIAQLKKAPFSALGFGLLGLVVPPFLAIILCVSIVGIPLGIMLFLLWVILMITGLVFTAFWVGEFLLSKMSSKESQQRLASLLVGLLALFAVTLLPRVGGLIMLVAIMWGEGAVWYAWYRHHWPKKDVKSKEETA